MFPAKGVPVLVFLQSLLRTHTQRKGHAGGRSRKIVITIETILIRLFFNVLCKLRSERSHTSASLSQGNQAADSTGPMLNAIVGRMAGE